MDNMSLSRENIQKLGINLQIRNLENELVNVLNLFSSVPIEAQRTVLQGLTDKISALADKQITAEMENYKSLTTDSNAPETSEPS